MNKIILLLLLPLLPLMAQEYTAVDSDLPLSFRNQALGGTVNDHLDLVYDPIELSFVEGTHLFTNLSNVTSGNEQLFDGVSDNAYLLGVSSRNRFIPNLWSALLVSFRDSRENGPIVIDSDLDGFADIFEQGEYENLFNAFLDIDNNGLFDIEQRIRQQKSNFPRRNQAVLTLNNTILASGWTYGFRFRYGRYEDRGNQAAGVYGSGAGPLFGTTQNDPSFLLNYDVDEVGFNRALFEQDEQGDFDTANRRRFWDVSLSMMNYFQLGNIEQLELRMDAGIRGERQTLDIDDSYQGSYANYNANILAFQDSFFEQQTDVTEQEDKASGFHLGLGGKKVFQKAPERRHDGFWSVSVNYQRMELDYRMSNTGTVNRDRNLFDGADTLLADVRSVTDSRLDIRDDGNGTAQSIALNGRINYRVGEQVVLGMAARYSYRWIDRTSEFTSSNMTDTRFEEIDNLLSNDYRLLLEESFAADRDFFLRRHQVILPVGLEYRFTESRKWALRIGAIFDYVRDRTSDRFQVTSLQPRVITRTFDDGRVDIEVVDDSFESRDSRLRSRQSSSVFTYGLGYQATEALQVDLLGFWGNSQDSDLLDTAFWRSLRLSVALRL